MQESSMCINFSVYPWYALVQTSAGVGIQKPLDVKNECKSAVNDGTVMENRTD